jgi:hypothetical protein
MPRSHPVLCLAISKCTLAIGSSIPDSKSGSFFFSLVRLLRLLTKRHQRNRFALVVLASRHLASTRPIALLATHLPVAPHPSTRVYFSPPTLSSRSSALPCCLCCVEVQLVISMCSSYENAGTRTHSTCQTRMIHLLHVYTRNESLA